MRCRATGRAARGVRPICGRGQLGGRSRQRSSSQSSCSPLSSERRQSRSVRRTCRTLAPTSCAPASTAASRSIDLEPVPRDVPSVAVRAVELVPGVQPVAAPSRTVRPARIVSQGRERVPHAEVEQDPLRFRQQRLSVLGPTAGASVHQHNGAAEPGSGQRGGRTGNAGTDHGHLHKCPQPSSLPSAHRRSATVPPRHLDRSIIDRSPSG